MIFAFRSVNIRSVDTIDRDLIKVNIIIKFSPSLLVPCNKNPSLLDFQTSQVCIPKFEELVLPRKVLEVVQALEDAPTELAAAPQAALIAQQLQVEDGEQDVVPLSKQ